MFGPILHGNQFNVKTVRSNPADPGAVTGIYYNWYFFYLLLFTFLLSSLLFVYRECHLQFISIFNYQSTGQRTWSSFMLKENMYFQNGVILDLFFGFIVVDKTAESELMYSNMIFEFLGINKVSSNLKCRLVFPSSKG